MNILMYLHDKYSLDPIIILYLKKYANVYLISKSSADITINDNDWVEEEAIETFARTHKITHFFYVENSTYIPIFLNNLPKSVIKVMLLVDTHINWKRRLPYFSLFDLILLVNKHQVKKLSKYNPNTIWLTYGGDTESFYKLPNSEKKYNVVFNGNIIPWVHYHRFFMLAYLKLRGVDVLYSTARYKHHNKLFNEAKIVLNRTPLGGWNLRFFEVLSSGSFLMTDRSNSQIDEIFIDKKHLVYFDSLADLKNKIDYYLGHEAEREKIANRGYEYVRKYYSWDNQIKKMLKILRTHKIKSFKRAPYYLSLYDLECFSFRNRMLASWSLRKSLESDEINYFDYYYYLFKCVLYLYPTDAIIFLLNFIRVNILIKLFETRKH